MRLARLWQPRNPVFWHWVAYNAMSSMLAWGMRWPGLRDGAVLLFGVLALVNVVLGLRCLWLLLSQEPPP